MDRANVEGVELAYRVVGDGAAGSVVILHGLLASSREWAGVARTLAEAGWRVLTLDSPGHGASSAPDDAAAYEGPRLAATVHRLARDLGFTPAVVIGHSWGGLIAEEYAIAHPADVTALVLVDTGGGGPRDYQRPPGAAAMFERETRTAFDEGMEALWRMHQEEGLWASAVNLPLKTQGLL